MVVVFFDFFGEGFILTVVVDDDPSLHLLIELL